MRWAIAALGAAAVQLVGGDAAAMCGPPFPTVNPAGAATAADAPILPTNGWIVVTAHRGVAAIHEQLARVVLRSDSDDDTVALTLVEEHLGFLGGVVVVLRP